MWWWSGNVCSDMDFLVGIFDRASSVALVADYAIGDPYGPGQDRAKHRGSGVLV
jgi:hypothetical protein